MRAHVAIIAVLLSACVSACASRRAAQRPANEEPGAEKSQFPSPEELAAVTAHEITGALQPQPSVDVERWTLEGPFPEKAGSTPGIESSVLSKHLHEAISGQTQAELTEQMNCVAHEMARFQLANEGKYPSQLLRAFIIGRCGALVQDAGSSWVGGTVPESTGVEGFIPELDKVLPKTIKAMPKGPSEVGISYARDGKRVRMVIAYGIKKAQLEEIKSGDAPGEVVLRGRVLIETANVTAVMTRGKFGVSECAINLAVKLPDFEASCASDVKDALAWIELAAFPPGRALGKVVLRTLVSPAGTPSNEHVRASMGRKIDFTDPRGATEELVKGLNEARHEAGFLPLVLDGEESKTASKVAPYFFAATFGKLPETIADTVALGVRAGWNVAGTVSSGEFTSAATSATDDLDVLIASSLALPFSRRVLLDPDARRIAVGAVFLPEQQFTGAILSTYRLIETVEYPKLIARVLQRVNKLRGSKGRAEISIDKSLSEEAVKLSGQLAEGTVGSEGATQQLMELAVNTWRLPVKAWRIETWSLDDYPIPDDLISQPGDPISVVIAPLKKNGQPWALWTIVIVFVAPKEAPPPVTT